MIARGKRVGLAWFLITKSRSCSLSVSAASRPVVVLLSPFVILKVTFSLKIKDYN